MKKGDKVNTDNLHEILSTKQIVIPSSLLIYAQKLNISSDDILLLSYLMGFGKEIVFDVSKFSKDLSWSIDTLMNIVSKLCENNLMMMIVKKDKNLMKEYLSIEPIYQKIISFIIDEQEQVDYSDEIYTIIEKEFARPLSPIEYETIKHWKDSKIEDSLIKEALKEAVLNGVLNLRYIEKILSDWKKKGYKKVSDIAKKKTDEEVDIFDCDWLNENE